jgi:hypothetical protein
MVSHYTKYPVSDILFLTHEDLSVLNSHTSPLKLLPIRQNQAGEMSGSEALRIGHETNNGIK